VRIHKALLIAAIAASGALWNTHSVIPLTREVWHHEGGGFQVRPPAGWTAVSARDGAGLPPVFQGLQVVPGQTPLGPSELGTAVVFLAPSIPALGFRPVLSIAVLATSSRPPGDASTPETLLTSRGPFLATESAQRMPTGDGMATHQAYRYEQRVGTRVLQLATEVAIVRSTDQSRYFLMSLTAPADRFGPYRLLFRRVVRTFHEAPAPQLAGADA
jgi:hypothetical protein